MSGEKQRYTDSQFIRMPSPTATAGTIDVSGAVRLTVMGGALSIQPVTDLQGGTDVGAPIALADGESWEIAWRFVTVTGTGTYSVV